MPADMIDSALNNLDPSGNQPGILPHRRLWKFSLRAAYAIYQILLHLGLPVILMLLFLRSRKEPMYRQNLRERFGLLRRPQISGGIFFYAVSLGETRAASRVIQSLLDQGETIILTHGSPAGLLAGRTLFAKAIQSGQMVHGYLPADLFWAVRIFLDRQKPRLGIVVEAELWPALLAEARRVSLPMVQINGNYTERAFERDISLRGLGRGEFWKFYSRIVTKSQERAERYLRAGVDPDRVRNVGELKFDLEVKADQKHAAEAFVQTTATGSVFTIASSIEAEEEVLIKLVQALRAGAETPPRIVWVPRSPQRFGPVAERLEQAGFRTIRRSRALNERLVAQPDTPDWDVLVGDSIGEMDFYYTLGDVVFVGATLAPEGGHNIIEPLALERPVVTGPSIYGIAYPAYDAIDAGAMISKNTAEELSDLLVALYSNVKLRSEFAAKTTGFNQNHKGASERTLRELSPFLELRQ